MSVHDDPVSADSAFGTQSVSPRQRKVVGDLTILSQRDRAPCFPEHKRDQSLIVGTVLRQQHSTGWYGLRHRWLLHGFWTELRFLQSAEQPDILQSSGSDRESEGAAFAGDARDGDRRVGSL